MQQLTIVFLSVLILFLIGFILWQIRVNDKLQKELNQTRHLNDITAGDVATELFKAHKHVGTYLKWDYSNSEVGEDEYIHTPEKIVYEEDDVINIIKWLGYPEPDWERSKV